MTEFKNVKNDVGEWFGDIPCNWASQRIKTLFNMRDERNYLPLSEVNLISLYTSTGVHQHADIEHTTGNKARNADGYKIVEKDDIVVNILLCWMGAIGRSDYNGVTSPAYDIYIPKSGVNSKYYHYLFRTPLFSQQCYKAGKGIMSMRWRTYSPQFRNIVVPVPPLSEQDQIVRFLDWKMSKINSLINIKRKEIKTLFELRQQSITHELNGNKVWFKRLLIKPMQYGANSSGTAFDPLLPRYIRITDIDSEGNLKEEGAKSIELGEASPYILEDGDILLARSGATVGKSFIFRNEYGYCAYAGYLIRAKLNQSVILPEYFIYFTNSSIYSNWKDSVFIQATIQNISAERYSRLSIPVPSVEKQNEIILRLNTTCNKINALIDIHKEQIKALKEYRLSLISDVVTGKIDVRNIEIPDYEYIEEENDIANDIEDDEVLTEEE